MFFYERWDVYQALLELRDIAVQLHRKRLRGFGPDLAQLNRAASSAVANLAEGAREQQTGKKIERYRVSLSSVSECNGVLTVLERHYRNDKLISKGRELCERCSAMLTRLIESVEQRSEMPPPAHATTRAPRHRQPPPPPSPPPPPPPPSTPA